MGPQDYAADGLQTATELLEGFFPVKPVQSVPAVEIKPEPDPLDHSQLGIRTERGSQPWCLDHVLLQNVGRPLTPEKLAALAGVPVKKARIHCHYWMGENVDGSKMAFGENGWSLKRSLSGLHTRLRRALIGSEIAYYLLPR